MTLLFKKAFYMTSRWIVTRLMTAKKYLGKQKWRSNLRKSAKEWPRIEQSFATWHFIGRHFSQVVAKKLFLQIYLEPNPEPFYFYNFRFRSGHRAVEATNHPSAVDREKSCQVVDSINMSDTVSVQSFASDNPSVGMQVTNSGSALGSNTSC